ncbi:MAG TPA: DUF4097 family beta strand repeat-containing protein [Steroidobacteraceae bacterium]|nr:DUF4097 family beta strand repeat-containing protein [Steroidobacteraceae bacterium]
MKTFANLLGAVSLCVGYAASAATVERTEPASAHGEVQVINVAGTVRVTGWDRSEVEVKANLGEGVERLDFHVDGEHTMIQVILPRRKHSSDTELTIHVPRDSRLDINTVSADQSIQDVHGAQRLQSVSGDIGTQVWSREFEARSVSGDIVAKGQAPKAGDSARSRISSVSGDVRVENLGDDIDVESVSGDMSLQVQALTRAHIRTTNGNARVTGGLSRDARIDAESVNGDLSFTFDSGVDAEFDIETFNGHIDNCFGPKPRKSHEYGPGNELRFKEGEGHAQVRVKTMNGKVRICREK